MKIPHYDEILLLTKLEEPLSENDNDLSFSSARSDICQRAKAIKSPVASHKNICTNIRALNTTLIKKQSLEEKTLRDLQQACRELHKLRNKINKLLAAYYGE
ncbi:MAG: hypothetical protein IKR09_00265 [Alphaproteobacteria bacterium]|nr:hypothetical protein [Alphaproteobacteria bacterium]